MWQFHSFMKWAYQLCQYCVYNIHIIYVNCEPEKVVCVPFNSSFGMTLEFCVLYRLCIEMYDLYASMHKQVCIPKLCKSWIYYTSMSFSTLMWNGEICVNEFVICTQMSLTFARSRMCEFWKKKTAFLVIKLEIFHFSSKNMIYE